jgi:hypothetical protein
MVAEIARFGQGTTVADQAGALSALIKSKRHHQASKEPQFIQGVEALLRAASDGPDPAEWYGMRTKRCLKPRSRVVAPAGTVWAMWRPSSWNRAIVGYLMR